MSFTIRPAKIEDAEDIQEIRLQQEVMPNILSVPSESVDSTYSWLENLNTATTHLLVAVVDEKVVGIVSLMMSNRIRQRHIADIGIMVNYDYHNLGIGTALMNAIIDLADNWLGLLRLELDVFTTNEKAIRLYETMGFVIEGTKSKDTFTDGKFIDSHIMARINVNSCVKL